MATAESGMGLSLYHMGDYAHSRQWLERALQLAQATGLRRWEAGTLIQLGLLDLAEQRMPLARQHLEEGLAIARDCRSGEYSAAGSALVARMHRLQGDFTCSLHHAEEALEAARRFGLSGLEMLSELELGLGHLELGESQSALLHTRRAVDLIPRASQEWIGHEEAYLGFASALRAVKQEQGACLQEGYAMQALQAKANLISNPHRRSMFVQVRTKQVDPFSLHAGLGASL